MRQGHACPVPCGATMNHHMNPDHGDELFPLACPYCGHGECVIDTTMGRRSQVYLVCDRCHSIL